MDRDEISLRAESPLQPDVQALFKTGDQFYEALYPADSNHLVTARELVDAGADFVVMRSSGVLLGCAAIVDFHDRTPNYGEVKRLYVTDAARGKGVGRQIMTLLMDNAIKRGLRRLRLEVGIRQSEAISLYRSLGFKDVPPFGDYQADPLSLFMELVF